MWLHKSKISFHFNKKKLPNKNTLYLEIIECTSFVNGMGSSKCFKVLEIWNFYSSV